MFRTGRFEWPTWVLLALTYLVWALGTTWAAGAWLPLSMVLVTLSAAQHSSLCHEALHGHPTRWARVNEALVFPALSLLIPYQRFRDTHIAHHNDEILTDPYDDPETNFQDPAVWESLPGWTRLILRINNTLAGRMVLGPAIAQGVFMRADWRAIRAGDRVILAGWMWHVPAVAVVIWWVARFGQMPVWAFLLSSYAALSILKIRTYLEHRAHPSAKGRTVIIEDRGPLSLIFLNNNYHVVHHAHPGMAWYELPARYEADREAYLERNKGYYYRSYAQIFRRYFWHAKDPVPHPLFRAGE
ncbi:fatty acid desaturase [Alisedimentitalea sp. MJ-SS2]|uniref:fatty acid desaturase n=1 Tax=Aliisedimentitalea sp. MJ-SS2 TaxID=3049795 RepID=UPI002913B59D|nr:fatty acid desaturase [Alisedimentitalea sp. MJ-SS2]MDU8927135.1 fatty acid desaturase [Alisedimentitalea sp. MJ-SS2]